MKTVMIALDKIEQNENSRVVYKEQDLAELMASMRKDGLLQPIGVRKLPSGKYDAVFGNRRILAAKKLGWNEISANVLDLETDIDRDIINLVENFKRQNTSVSEEGRMFSSLKDRGLSETEIAARLDVPVTRVRFAMDVIRHVPDDIQKKIKYSPKRKLNKDVLAATTAIAAMNVRRSSHLNRDQFRTLLEYATKKAPTPEQLNKVAPLVKMGVNIEDAIEQVASLKRVTFNCYIPEENVKKLEKRFQKSIQDILRDRLATFSDLKMVNLDNKGLGSTRLRKQASRILVKGDGANAV